MPLHLGDKLSITLVQSPDHILNTYDERISRHEGRPFFTKAPRPAHHSEHVTLHSLDAVSAPLITNV